MTIDSLKDLEKLFKLCRKQGVASITVDGITFELGALPVKQTKSKDYDLELPPEATMKIPLYVEATPTGGSLRGNAGSAANGTGVQQYVQSKSTASNVNAELTEEQMLFYSARPEPQ